MKNPSDLLGQTMEWFIEDLFDDKQKRYKELIPSLYTFLAGYKENSGIFINNFLCKRNYDDYCRGKFESHDDSIPNYFDDINFSSYMKQHLRNLERARWAYVPVNVSFIDYLITVAEALELAPVIRRKTLYHGCLNLEESGMNGLVSVTASEDVAKKFSRGTIVTLHIPEGMKGINVRRIKPVNQRKNDKEEEFILAPCSFEVIGEEVVSKNDDESNNPNDYTQMVDVVVRPLDLLEEFYKAMENPPEDYLKIRELQGDSFDEAKEYLREYLEKRRQNTETQVYKR